MKKTIFAAFALAALLTSVSCGGTKADTTAPAEVGEQAAEELTEAPTIRPTDVQHETVAAAEFEYEIVDGKAVVTKYTGPDGAVEVPAELGGAPVGAIGFYAFEAKFGVTSVKLPETVTVIGGSAFMDCAGMTEINIPAAVNTVERGAFAACTSLESVKLPAAVTRVDEEAFTACTSMKTLFIENPDLEYANWGLEELPDLMIYAPADSAVSRWVTEKGFKLLPED